MQENYVAYYDETGDDGNNTSSSDTFLLTSIYMPMNKWQNNFDILISYFTHLYYKCFAEQKNLPNRITNCIDENFIKVIMNTFKKYGKINLNANKSSDYGIVIYPK